MNGLFSYDLGEWSCLPHDLFATGAERWLGIKVGTDDEISPRTKLSSVPFAYHSLRADSAGHAGIAGVGQCCFNPRPREGGDGAGPKPQRII